MHAAPLHPTLRLAEGGILSLLALFAFGLASEQYPGFVLALGGAGTGGFLVLIPVLMRGNSWQRMIAGAMLFVPSFALVMVGYTVVCSLLGI
jgi:hypothetical protein